MQINFKLIENQRKTIKKRMLMCVLESGALALIYGLMVWGFSAWNDSQFLIGTLIIGTIGSMTLLPWIFRTLLEYEYQLIAGADIDTWIDMKNVYQELYWHIDSGSSVDPLKPWFHIQLDSMIADEIYKISFERLLPPHIILQSIVTNEFKHRMAEESDEF